MPILLVRLFPDIPTQKVTSKKEKVRDRDKPRTRKKKPGSSKRSREVRIKLATS